MFLCQYIQLHSMFLYLYIFFCVCIFSYTLMALTIASILMMFVTMWTFKLTGLALQPTRKVHLINTFQSNISLYHSSFCFFIFLYIYGVFLFHFF